MRRSDREITDINEIIAVMNKCDVCRLALNDENYPYILPLNFGMNVENDIITLYFHGALNGKKYELIEKDNRASFEMDCSHILLSDRDSCKCTMKYESIIGAGRIEILPDNEKNAALSFIMHHYHEEFFPINEAVISQTKVMKLVVEHITGKAR